jgi:hypothetical protein
MTPQEENARLQQQVNQELAAFNDAQKDATDKTKKRAETEAKIEQVTGTVIQTFEKLYMAQLKYQLSIAKGSKGAATFNDSIDAMTDATQAAAVALSLLVPGGALVKGVVAGLTFLATTAMKTAAEWQKLANEQADATYKAFQAFSKAGATGSDGLKGFFNDVNRMRLNVHQLDAMAGAMASNAKEMAGMGGTVYKARGQFADLVQGMGSFEKGMLNLGMSYDEQAEAALGYMKLQNSLSQGQQRDYGKMAGAARKYIEEQEALARVTGMNRKEQEAAQEKFLAQQRFGAKIQELMDEGTDESRKKAELLRQGMERAAAQGETFAQAYADQVTGMITTDAAMKGNQSTQGKQMEQINDILEGRITNENQLNQSQQELLETTKEVGKTFNKAFQAGVGEDFLAPFKEFQKTSQMANNNFAEQMKDAKNEVDKLTGTIAGADTQLNRFTDLIKAQNEKMLKDQAALNGQFSTATAGGGFMDKLMKAFQPLIDHVMKLANIFEPLASGLGDMLIGAITAVVQLMTGDIIGGLKTFKEGWDSAAKGLEETTKRWIDTTIETWKNFGLNLLKSVEFITGPLGPVFEKAGEAISGFTDGVKTGISKFSDMLVDMIKSLWEKISALIPDLGGVKKAAGAAADYAKGAAGAVGDWVSSKVGGGGAAAPAGAAAAPAGGGRGGGAGGAGGMSRTGGAGAAPAGGGTPAPAPSAAPSAGAGDGGKPPADKPVPPKPAGEAQSGAEVRIGNEIRKGGTVSWRTNNPGNISYGELAKKFGAIAPWKKMDGDLQQRTTGIAIMPTLEDGDRLKMALWRRPMYIDKTIDQGVAQWTGTTGLGSGYAKDLAKAAGATMDTVIGQLSDSQLLSMVTKQRVWEGFKAGQVIQAADGGVFDGPKSGYSATLHGPEAVIPLKDGAVPVSMSQEFNMTAANLGELVNIMKSNVGMQNQMLAVLDEMRRSQSTMADNTGKMVAMAS